MCEWPQTQKLVINTTNPSYSYTGKYYLPVDTDVRPKHVGKYQTQPTVALVHSPQLSEKKVHIICTEHKGHNTFTML